MIAKRFKVEEKEFVFYESGAPLMPLSIKLYDNPEYKGETGMLRRILELKEIPSNMVFSEEEEDEDGMLAGLFEAVATALKAQQ
ncbi:hypothetical protein H4S04_006669 [Coemansia sp. S16]|nr:hypothetical protein H4S04_006669 [Coemansia sp. S16]